MALLSRVLQFNDYDFYLAGRRSPNRMMGCAATTSPTAGFTRRHLVRRHWCGSPTGRRGTAAASAGRDHAGAGHLAASMKEARWTQDRNAARLAEARGLSPAFSCREGNCGAAELLLAGAVTYLKEPTAEVAMTRC